MGAKPVMLLYFLKSTYPRTPFFEIITVNSKLVDLTICSFVEEVVSAQQPPAVRTGVAYRYFLRFLQASFAEYFPTAADLMGFSGHEGTDQTDAVA